MEVSTLKSEKEMYGLPQTGLLAQEQLIKNLKDHWYYQSKLVPGLSHHSTRPITVTLVVGGFRVKYTNKKNPEHSRSVLKRYIGIYMRWDYK